MGGLKNVPGLFNTRDCLPVSDNNSNKIILIIIIYLIQRVFTQQSPMLSTLMYCCGSLLVATPSYTHPWSFSLTISPILAGCAEQTLHSPTSLAAICSHVMKFWFSGYGKQCTHLLGHSFKRRGHIFHFHHLLSLHQL